MEHINGGINPMVSNWMQPLFIWFASQRCPAAEQEFSGRGSNFIDHESGLEQVSCLKQILQRGVSEMSHFQFHLY